MERQTVFMWVLVSGLLSQNLVMSTEVGDQKTYYSPPDPHAGTPPSGSHHTPSHGTPSHGTPSYGTPSHGTPSYGTPSHGTPSHGTPSYGTPSHGTPSQGGNCSPTTPTYVTPPSHGGGGTVDPRTPPTPSGGGGYYNSPPPSGGTVTPPVTISPPTTPIVIPGSPSITIPATPPFVFDPNSPFTGTCNFWRNHPTVIWGLVGWWGTLGGAFGGSTFPGSAPTLSLPQALSNTRTDGYGALYREGTASLLNSMVNHRFPYTTSHVRDSFVAALGSNRAAAAQAQLFKMANEGRLNPKA